jgi:hypothetical protein
VPVALAEYVVPFEARTKYVGPEFFRELAQTLGGEFRRNPQGLGIVESLANLRGPHFDDSLIDPLIREFYEHTSRFTLSIRPQWSRRMRPAYWLYKRLIAEAIGQANLPMDARELQEGVVSYIDTIGLHGGSGGNGGGSGIVDLRGWVRAYKHSGEAIYVGIYTTMRHADVGYVSVGFPLPRANFTATLLPRNRPGGGLLLGTRDTGLPYPGHYLSELDAEGGLMVVKLPTFGEELEVYLQAGDLRAEHRFYLNDRAFVTLYYTIERLAAQEGMLAPPNSPAAPESRVES